MTFLVVILGFSDVLLGVSFACGSVLMLDWGNILTGANPFEFVRSLLCKVLFLLDIEERVETVLLRLGLSGVAAPSVKLFGGLTAPFLVDSGGYRHICLYLII